MKNIFIPFLFLLSVVSCVNPGEVEKAEVAQTELGKIDPQAFMLEVFIHKCLRVNFPKLS